MTQPQATEVENVNPFNVIVFMGGIILDPPSDNWVRTIYTEENRQESSGAKWVEVVTDTPTVLYLRVQWRFRYTYRKDIQDPDFNLTEEDTYCNEGNTTKSRI